MMPSKNFYALSSIGQSNFCKIKINAWYTMSTSTQEALGQCSQQHALTTG